MTAEQLLIEENKINPKIKFITKSRNEIWFWRSKPKYLGYWCNGSGYKIGMSVTFDGKEDNDCILCIDDIKPEAPPIPEKWSLRVNKDTIMYINKTRKEPLDINKYAFVNNCVGHVLHGHNCIASGYPEITLEQFKKHVLESKENQEEIQEPNSFFNPTDSYEKSGSIGSVEFSGKYIKTGRISSSDINLDLFVNANNDISFEFYNAKCWIEDRINYINQFIKKTIDSDLCINPEWISERNELIEKLKNL